MQEFGPNRLPEGRKRGPLARLLSQFNNVLVYVLLGAGFTKLMLSLWIDAAIILGVVILNGLLGFIQEGRAEKALDSIRNMLSAEARTIRGGATRMIPAEELVPGDLVLLESGDKVPADLRLTDVNNFRTEEAALTGESVPAEKTTRPVSANATVGDRECLAFSGTMVVSGRAKGVVVATGSGTELGRINQLLAGVDALETPLLRQIKQFGYAITAVLGVVSVLVFAYGRWGLGMAFVDIFQAVVGIAVSVIPEGLPAIITITLAIGVQRMAQLITAMPRRKRPTPPRMEIIVAKTHPPSGHYFISAPVVRNRRESVGFSGCCVSAVLPPNVIDRAEAAHSARGLVHLGSPRPCN
jgi:magnesium-transporting ATPase (P-type)